MARGEKQTITIPFGAGISEDIDERLLSAPLAADLDNVIFTKKGALQKKRGFSTYDGTDLPTDTSGLNQIFELNTHPCVYGKGALMTHSTTAGGWLSNRNPHAFPASVRALDRSRTIDDTGAVDCAAGNNLLVRVWVDQTITWYSVHDLVSNTLITPPQGVLTAFTEVAQVVFHPGLGVFLLLARDVSDNLVSAVLDPSSSYNFVEVGTVRADCGAFAVKADDTDAFFAIAVDVSGSNPVYIEIDSAGGFVQEKSTALTATLAVDLWYDPTGNFLYAACLHTTGDVYISKVDDALTTVTNSAAVFTHTTLGSEGLQGRVAVGLLESGRLWVAASYVDRLITHAAFSTGFSPQPQSDRAHTQWGTFSTAFVPYTETRTVYNYIVASQMVKVSTDIFVAVEYYGVFYSTSEWQQAQFHTVLLTVDEASVALGQDGVPTAAVLAREVVVAKYNTDTADGATVGRPSDYAAILPPGHLATADGLLYHNARVILGSEQRNFAYSYVGGTYYNIGDYVTHAAALTVVDTSPPPCRAIADQRTAALSAGTVLSFDDHILTPCTFFGQPEIEAVTSATGAGFPDVSTWPLSVSMRFVVVATYTDAAGTQHRTAPSIPALVTARTSTAVTDEDKAYVVTCVLPALGFPDINFYGGVNIAVYVQEPSTDAETITDSATVFGSSDAGAYYKVAEENFSNLSEASYSVTWTAGEMAGPFYAVWTLLRLPPLYTTGGILPAASPPAMIDLVSLADRLAGISAENRNEVWVTKPGEYKLFPEWAAELTITLPTHIELTALASMDEKIVLFSEQALFLVAGDLPDAGGSLGSSPVRLPAASGCTNAKSVVEGPFGVVYEGMRGFFLLDRGLNVSYIGGPVEGTLYGKTISSAVLVPYDQEVRWTTDEGVMLVWDYVRGVWSTRDCDTQAAALVDGRYFYCRNTPQGWAVAAERLVSDTVFTDVSVDGAGSQVTNAMSVTTSWLKLTGLQGFQRISRVLLLGYWRDTTSTNSISVSFAYNYDDTVRETHTRTPPGNNQVMQELFVPGYLQKCEAIKITITEASGAVGGELTKAATSGFTLTGIALEVMATSQHFKQLGQGRKS